MLLNLKKKLRLVRAKLDCKCQPHNASESAVATTSSIPS